MVELASKNKEFMAAASKREQLESLLEKSEGSQVASTGLQKQVLIFVPSISGASLTVRNVVGVTAGLLRKRLTREPWFFVSAIFDLQLAFTFYHKRGPAAPSPYVGIFSRVQWELRFLPFPKRLEFKTVCLNSSRFPTRALE